MSKLHHIFDCETMKLTPTDIFIRDYIGNADRNQVKHLLGKFGEIPWFIKEYFNKIPGCFRSQALITFKENRKLLSQVLCDLTDYTNQNQKWMDNIMEDNDLFSFIQMISNKYHNEFFDKIIPSDFIVKKYLYVYPNIIKETIEDHIYDDITLLKEVLNTLTKDKYFIMEDHIKNYIRNNPQLIIDELIKNKDIPSNIKYIIKCDGQNHNSKSDKDFVIVPNIDEFNKDPMDTQLEADLKQLKKDKCVLEKKITKNLGWQGQRGEYRTELRLLNQKISDKVKEKLKNKTVELSLEDMNKIHTLQMEQGMDIYTAIDELLYEDNKYYYDEEHEKQSREEWEQQQDKAANEKLEQIFRFGQEKEKNKDEQKKNKEAIEIISLVNSPDTYYRYIDDLKELSQMEKIPSMHFEFLIAKSPNMHKCEKNIFDYYHEFINNQIKLQDRNVTCRITTFGDTDSVVFEGTLFDAQYFKQLNLDGKYESSCHALHYTMCNLNTEIKNTLKKSVGWKTAPHVWVIIIADDANNKPKSLKYHENIANTIGSHAFCKDFNYITIGIDTIPYITTRPFYVNFSYEIDASSVLSCIMKKISNQIIENRKKIYADDKQWIGNYVQ